MAPSVTAHYLWFMGTREPVLAKKDVLEALKEMPKDVKLDDFFDRLLLLAKIERGMAEAKAGKGYTTAEARKRVKRWSK